MNVSSLSTQTIDAVRTVFAEAVEKHQVAGLSWGIAQGGELIASGGEGHSHLAHGAPTEDSVTPDACSISRIASMTKSFTAATILALRDEKKLRLDDPVAQYLPEFSRAGRASEDSPEVTLRHLLTMSAGFVTDNPWGDRQESMSRTELAELLSGGLAFVGEPGGQFEYSNLGYVLLGRVIDEVTGGDYASEIRQRFIEPLGMRDTAFSLEEFTPEQRTRVLMGHRVRDREGLDRFEEVEFDTNGTFGAMAGIFSTVRDIALWTAFLAEAGTGGGSNEHRAILSVASRREMQEIQRIQEWPPLEDGTGYARVRGYGFGLVVEKFPKLGDVISHSGGYPGYGSYMVWLRESGLTLIALANSKYAPMIACCIKGLEEIVARESIETARKAELADGTRAALEGALSWLREAVLEEASDTRLLSGSAAWVRKNHGGPERLDLFAENMDQDVSRAERLRLRDAALQVASLSLADLTLEHATVKAVSPAQARATWEGATGTIQLDLLMEPRVGGKIQALNVKGTPKATGEATGAAPIGI